MDVNEKAQRLMLLTNIRFRLDNKSGEIIESDEPIPEDIIKQAMEMSDDEFQSRMKAQQRSFIINDYKKNLLIRCAYKAYSMAVPDKSFEDFVGEVIDEM